MANLAASLFAAEAIVTTEAKAKALRPYAEKLITKAKKGGLHRYRDTLVGAARRGHGPQALPRHRPPLRRPQRRLHADPEARPPPRRQRPHGADRAGLTLTLFDPPAGTRAALERAARPRPARWSPTTARRSTASPPSPASPRSAGTLGRDARAGARPPGRADVRRAHRRRRARLGPGRQLRRRRRPVRPRQAPGGGERPVRPVDRRARRPRSRADGFDARFDATQPALPLHGAEPAGARPVPGGHVVARAAAARPRPPAPGVRPAHRRARLHVVLPPAQGRARRSRSCAGCSTPAGRPSGDGVLRFWIEATAFCHQMVRSIVGTLVDVGLGKRTAADVGRRPASQEPLGRRPRRPTPRPRASGRSRTSERGCRCFTKFINSVKHVRPRRRRARQPLPAGADAARAHSCARRSRAT